jgi:hypothetical protein
VLQTKEIKSEVFPQREVIVKVSLEKDEGKDKWC